MGLKFAAAWHELGSPKSPNTTEAQIYSWEQRKGSGCKAVRAPAPEASRGKLVEKKIHLGAQLHSRPRLAVSSPTILGPQQWRSSTRLSSVHTILSQQNNTTHRLPHPHTEGSRAGYAQWATSGALLGSAPRAPAALQPPPPLVCTVSEPQLHAGGEPDPSLGPAVQLRALLLPSPRPP